MATNIQKYTKKDGSKAYMFKIYLGIDPLTGKRIETTRRGFSTKKAAQLALNQLKIDFATGKLKDKTITFDELFKIWLESYKKTVKENTLFARIEVYNNVLKKEFGHLSVDKISILQCQNFVNKQAQKTKSLYKITTLNLLLSYAVKLDLITFNPVSRVIMPSLQNRTSAEKRVRDENNYLQKNELITLLKYAKSISIKKYTLYHFLAFTGLRCGEALALTWNDIDFSNNCVTINKTVQHFNKKTIVNTVKTQKSNRTIFLDDKTLSILKKWRTEQAAMLLKNGINSMQKTQLVFSNGKNSFLRVTNVTNTLETDCKRAGIKIISVHGFRHTHATLLLESGANIKEIQERLGHSKIQMTMDIYTHVTNDVNKKVADKFAKLFVN